MCKPHRACPGGSLASALPDSICLFRHAPSVARKPTSHPDRRGGVIQSEINGRLDASRIHHDYAVVTGRSTSIDDGLGIESRGSLSCSSAMTVSTKK